MQKGFVDQGGRRKLLEENREEGKTTSIGHTEAAKHRTGIQRSRARVSFEREKEASKERGKEKLTGKSTGFGVVRTERGEKEIYKDIKKCLSLSKYHRVGGRSQYT